MELKKQILKQNIQKSKAFTQVTLDDDCIVKDSKPDIIKIIHTKGSIIFEESKVNNQTVWVTGKLKFTVLYRSDGNAGKVETLSDTIDFGEKIMMDEEKDTGIDSEEIDLISATLINERTPTCYGTDKRWANHLYPVFLTESYVKSQYMSTEMFLHLF